MKQYRNHVVPTRHCPYCKTVISVEPRDSTIAAYYGACDAADLALSAHLTECDKRRARWERRLQEVTG